MKPDTLSETDPLTERLGLRLQTLRRELGLTLEDLSERTGISRATLSRIERGSTSPTTFSLGRLATALGRSISRLLADVESEPSLFVARAEQQLWIDPATGFRRQMVSPPAAGFMTELLECEIPAGVVIVYDTAPIVGLEQHVWMLAGELELTTTGVVYQLYPGDCLRFRLSGGSTRFATRPTESARYLIAVAHA